jgi:hypothetical protein
MAAAIAIIRPMISRTSQHALLRGIEAVLQLEQGEILAEPMCAHAREHRLHPLDHERADLVDRARVAVDRSRQGLAHQLEHNQAHPLLNSHTVSGQWPMSRGSEELGVVALDWRSALVRQVTTIPGEPMLEVPRASCGFEVGHAESIRTRAMPTGPDPRSQRACRCE